MSTPLTDSINALTAYANETTGAFDTTLSDAVGRLCEGYGLSGIVTAELLQTYKVPTSWENPTDGNTPAILKALGYTQSTLQVNEAYLIIVKGNTAIETAYRGAMFYKPRSTDGYMVRNNAVPLGAGSSYYFFVSEGAEIDVYKITYNLP